MSLSKSQSAAPRQPKVIAGLGSHGPTETTVGELQGQRDLTRWTSKTEEEYMARVRDRATGAAKEIITKAMADAEKIRENAAAEGFQSAVGEAQAQLDAAVAAHAQSLAGAMAALDQGQAALWAEHRADITALVRLAVERLLRIELEERREEILASVLDQALESIDSHRKLCIRVNPADEETVGGLMELAKEQHPGLDRWRVRTDESLEPGGMVLESAQGMVDNSLEGRMAAVMGVLDQLCANPAAAGKDDPA